MKRKKKKQQAPVTKPAETKPTAVLADPKPVPVLTDPDNTYLMDDEIKDKRHLPPDKINPFLDVCFGDTTYDGNVFIYLRDRKGRLKFVSSCKASELKDKIQTLHFSKRDNYYITRNGFSGGYRRKDMLFSMHNIVLDLDFHSESYMVNDIQLYERFKKLFMSYYGNDGILPMWKVVVFTGRGIQLWFPLDRSFHLSAGKQISFFTRYMALLIDRMLSEAPSDYLHEMKVDMNASMNLAGLVRMPWTVNQKAHKTVTYRIEDTDLLNLGRWCDNIDLELLNKLAPRPQAKRPSFPWMHKPDLLGSAGLWRVELIRKLIKYRDADVNDELRNNCLYATYNSCRTMVKLSDEEAMEQVYEINRLFKRPMMKSEIRSTLCSAIRVGGYKYTTEKFLEFLGIYEADYDALGLDKNHGQQKNRNNARDRFAALKRDLSKWAIIFCASYPGLSDQDVIRISGGSKYRLKTRSAEWEKETGKRLYHGDEETCKLAAGKLRMIIEALTEEVQRPHSFMLQAKNVQSFNVTPELRELLRKKTALGQIQTKPDMKLIRKTEKRTKERLAKKAAKKASDTRANGSGAVAMPKNENDQIDTEEMTGAKKVEDYELGYAVGPRREVSFGQGSGGFGPPNRLISTALLEPGLSGRRLPRGTFAPARLACPPMSGNQYAYSPSKMAKEFLPAWSLNDDDNFWRLRRELIQYQRQRDAALIVFGFEACGPLLAASGSA